MKMFREGVAVCTILMAWQCSAAHFTTTVAQPQNFDWFEPIWLPGPVPVSAGHTYQALEGAIIRNPISGSESTFPGDSLTLDPGSILRLKPPRGGVTTTVNFPGVNGEPGLILNGGGVDPGTESTLFVVGGKVRVAADSFVLGPFTSTRNLVIASELEGTGSLTVQGFFGNTGVTVQSESNRYSGHWLVSSGRLTGLGEGSLGTGDISIASGSRLEIRYDIVSPGVLTVFGRYGVMALTHDCQFSGALINGEMLPTGTHAFAQLKAKFPDSFPAAGSGSIRIVPLEPRLTITPAGEKLNVRFTTGYGHLYTLQTKGLGELEEWTAVDSTIVGDGEPKTQPAAAASSGAIYRVLVE